MKTFHIQVLAVRAYCYKGERIDVGAVTTMSALEAFDVVDGGRGLYVNPDDAEKARAAVRHAVSLACPTVGRRSAPAGAGLR